MATGALLASSFATSAFATNGDYEKNDTDRQSKYSQNHGERMGMYLGNRFIFMSGGQEVPGPGDPDGRGFAKVKAFPDKGKLCVHMRVYNIDPATAAHIHEAPKGQAGPVVIDLPKPDAEGRVQGCVDADSGKLTDIKTNPSNYYVNVHNDPYPNGAVRGQLH